MFGIHPHSGIATLTYVVEGAVTYIDPNGERGTLSAGGVEWMQAGRGMWHGGGLDQSGRTRGFQLWIALPPELELGPTISLFQAPEEVRREGPARVLLGSYRATSSAIESPAPIFCHFELFFAQFFEKKLSEDRYRGRHRWAARVDEPQAEVGARAPIVRQDANELPLRDGTLSH